MIKEKVIVEVSAVSTSGVYTPKYLTEITVLCDCTEN